VPRYLPVVHREIVGMKKLLFLGLSIILVIGVPHGIFASTTSPAPLEPVSGYLQNGYRILDINTSAENIHLTVYRGDYIKFVLAPSIGDPVLSIPALSIEQRIGTDLSKAPYFKMKNTGIYPFSLGHTTGRIEVIEYRQPNYRAVTSKEAAEFIADVKPLILDVRTPAEFKRGHLKDAVLIPVQELHKRIHELARYKNSDIFIYCATGNRSTVASKILADNGFKRIINLRYGIKEWSKMKYPVIR